MKKKCRNKLTVYCNYPVSPIKNTRLNLSHMPLSIRVKCETMVKNHLKLLAQPKYANLLNKVVVRYTEMCSPPLENEVKRDRDGYILFNWNLETMSFTPMNKKNLVVLIYDAISTGLDGKHIKINTNWVTALNMLRYFVYKDKLKDTGIEIVFNDESGKQTYKINKRGNYVNEDNEVTDLPSGFLDADLDELMEMMW